MTKYIPKKGDLIALTFDPQSGHEQKGRRPALVVSHTMFNRKTGLAYVCPVTSTDRSISLHVKLPRSCELSGVVMVDQMKSVDYFSRKATFIEKAPAEIVQEVLSILDAILYEE